jgi:HEPN domain-containing protein
MNGLQPAEVDHLWLQRARSDLALGKAALHTPGVLPEDACFHAQQCAEKALKGLLSNHAIPFPRTHVLEVLLDLLKAHGVTVPDSVDEAFALSQYAVQTRYPGEWEPVTREEAELVLERAALVLAWVETQTA